ncbi:hypothetical protein PABG_03652 [Paracoccidioides brasiliensis Pb03]|nr:hypothetical protein PABG_03652 [Paracoccidioides brasiliensis Pb03]ODH45487.1 hypothetical protein GX48_08435 [Paracoccidioides brasiliensis]
MESPHEQQQSLLLSRIITNVVWLPLPTFHDTTAYQGRNEKLNEAIMVLNGNLQEVNVQNMNVELVAQMFKNYQSNVLFHLEATEELKESTSSRLRTSPLNKELTHE